MPQDRIAALEQLSRAYIEGRLTRQQYSVIAQGLRWMGGAEW